MTALLPELGHYLDESDERVIGWADQLDKAMRTGHAVEAMEVYAYLCQLQGDMQRADKFFQRAEARGAQSLEIDNQRMLISLNLGFASQALAHARKLAAANVLDVVEGIAQAFICGGFSLVRGYMQQLVEHDVDLSPMRQFAQVRQIVEGTADLGFSDDQFAAVLDVAGTVMRERRLFWMEPGPRASFDHENRCASFRYRLEVTPSEASAIAGDFACRLIDAGLDAVPFAVCFIGLLPEPAEIEDQEAVAA